MSSKLEMPKGVSPRETKVRSASNATSNTINSNSNKMVGLGFSRRPSDNLLLSMTATLDGLDSKDNEGSAILPTPPPKKSLLPKSERPISNDSIATRTTDIFSASSSDVNSGTSSIDNDRDAKERISETVVPRLHQDVVSQTDESVISTDGFDKQTASPPPFLPLQQQPQQSLQQQSPTQLQQSPTQIHHQLPQHPSRKKHLFSSGNMATSQIALKPFPLQADAIEKMRPPMGPTFYGHSNSTSAILPNKISLTPSQRYRLRKAQNEMALRKSIRKKEKFYDEQEANSELKSDNFDASLVWNVPMASFPNSSFLEGADLQVGGHHSHHHSRHHSRNTHASSNGSAHTNNGSVRTSNTNNTTTTNNNNNNNNNNSNENNNNSNDVNNSMSTNTSDLRKSTSNRNVSIHPEQLHEPKDKSGMYNDDKTYYNSYGRPRGLPQPGKSFSYLNFYEMPTSPIPGLSNVSDFQYMQQTSANLTNVYENSSHTLSRTKLSERSASADFLPLEFKTASDLGLEDLILVSKNKLEVTSHSRPSWLPPKSLEEKKFHDDQISKSTSLASLEQLDRNRAKEERLIKDETNKQKYVLLLDRDITRNSSLQSLRKIIWETSLTDEVRYDIYDQVLQSNTRVVTTLYVESFQDMMDLLNKMDFPPAKEKEIEHLIDSGIRSKLSGQQDTISPNLLLMLKLKSISRPGLQPGDELLFHHFLQSGSFRDLQQVWDMVNLVQMLCFSDTCKEKYDLRILNSRGIVAHYLLKSDDFKEEFNPTALNSTTWWNVLQRLSHSLFMWTIDIIVVANSQCFKKYPMKVGDFKDKSWEYYRSKRVVNNYKILLAFVLNVLLNYHFGFNDLKSLSSVDDSNFAIPMPLNHSLDVNAVNSLFIRKWFHYYKKF